MGMEQELLLNQGLLQIPCRLSEPEDGDIRRVVLGVHGLGGSSKDTIQTAIAEEMAMFWGATIRFDFPAHGDSTLDSTGFHLQNCMDSLLAVANFAKNCYPQVEDLCIFATGFGAYITLLCLEELMELPGKLRLVVQTPSVRMHETLLAMKGITEEEFRMLKWIDFRTERPFGISYSFYQDMKDHTAMDSYPMPFLILQGEEDAFIPMSDILNLRRINEESKLVVIPGASHQFLESGAWDMVLDLTRDWFEFQQVLVTDWE